MVSCASNERLLAQPTPIVYEEEEVRRSRLFHPQKQPPRRRPGNGDEQESSGLLSHIINDDDSCRDPLSLPCTRWSEEDYLRNVVPWESLEEKAYVDTLLERRAHYKAIRVWVGVTCAFMLLIGWISLILYARWSGEDFRLGPPWSWKNHGGSTTVAKIVAGILLLICAPLWLSYESRTKEDLVDAELQRLTKKRLLLVEPSLSQTYCWDTPTRSNHHRRKKQKKGGTTELSSA